MILNFFEMYPYMSFKSEKVIFRAVESNSVLNYFGHTVDRNILDIQLRANLATF